MSVSTPAPEYRLLLREELLRRCRKNASYSARAFARDIGISPGYLSQVLGQRKSLNEERAFKIAESLAWKGKKARLFVTLVRFDNARDEANRARLQAELAELQGKEIAFCDLQLDAFHAVSKWYHYAILELTRLKTFKSAPSWIAKKLGITPLEAELAVERLRRLGLLEQRDGRWLKAMANYSTNYVPSEAIRTFHSELLKKAAQAVWEQEVEERDYSGITMAIDPASLPEARDRIQRFRRELMAFLETGAPKTIYHLAIQLFRLDRA